VRRHKVLKRQEHNPFGKKTAIPPDELDFSRVHVNAVLVRTQNQLHPRLERMAASKFTLNGRACRQGKACWRPWAGHFCFPLPVAVTNASCAKHPVASVRVRIVSVKSSSYCSAPAVMWPLLLSSPCVLRSCPNEWSLASTRAELDRRSLLCSYMSNCSTSLSPS
jgi:hypothetical protein